MSAMRYRFTAMIGLLMLGAGCVGADGGDEAGDSAEDQPAQTSEADMSGCHDNECIDIVGTDLYIGHVKSTFDGVYDPKACSRHHFTVKRADGTLLLSRYSAFTCVYHGDKGVHYWWPNRTFPNHSQACTTFLGQTACGEIHS